MSTVFDRNAQRSQLAREVLRELGVSDLYEVSAVGEYPEKDSFIYISCEDRPPLTVRCSEDVMTEQGRDSLKTKLRLALVSHRNS